jgi:N4-gp56 family major capsid protein
VAQTQVPVGSTLAKKVFGAALFANTQRAPTLMKNLTGPAPKQPQAEAKMKGQTTPDMPVVMVTDLSKSAGDAVSVDLFNIFNQKPLVGDVNAEGRGEKLSFASFDTRIDMFTKAGDAGGKMAQQRTVWNLRGLVLANLAGYMPRLETQQLLVHLAGSRGSQAGMDWVVPLQTDPDFANILVNAVKAPTFNRHYVASGTSIVNGGQQLGSIASTDIFKLEHLDALRAFIDDMDLPMQPVKIADDPAAQDEPLYIYLASPRQYQSLLTNTSGNVLRTFQQNAWVRAQYGSKHPLFKGEVGIWNGILVKKMVRSIRFNPGDSTQIITSANAATATESAQTVNAGLGAGKAVDRGLLLGAQALVNVYGKNQGSEYYYSFNERLYNFERNYEAAADAMNGKNKVRFSVPDGQGNTFPTDNGVLVFDTAVSLT